MPIQVVVQVPIFEGFSTVYRLRLHSRRNLSSHKVKTITSETAATSRGQKQFAVYNPHTKIQEQHRWYDSVALDKERTLSTKKNTRNSSWFGTNHDTVLLTDSFFHCWCFPKIEKKPTTSSKDALRRAYIDSIAFYSCIDIIILWQYVWDDADEMATDSDTCVSMMISMYTLSECRYR